MLTAERVQMLGGVAIAEQRDVAEVPSDDARLAETRFDDWLSQAVVSTP